VPVKKVTKKTAKQPVKKRAQKSAAKIAAAPSVALPVAAKLNATYSATLVPKLCIVGASEVELWGMGLRDRLIQQFAREGLVEVISAEEAKIYEGPVVTVRADVVLDQPLISVLLKRPRFALASDTDGQVLAAQGPGRDLALVENAMQAGVIPAGYLGRKPSELDTSFWAGLRKREVPYALQVRADNSSEVAWRMFMGTYKGATDFITKHVWPRPAFYVTQYLAARGISPNMVTSVGAFCTVLAFVLFWHGDYAAGLTAAWLMTFLDTVDGKLARTTLTSSKWGNVFDHGIDLVHPPFWYVAWAMGLGAWQMGWDNQLFAWVIGIIVGGYVLQRLMEGIAIQWLGLEIHIWRKIDTLFRQVTARRNPNLAILTGFTLMGRPDWGLIAVAGWTAICLALHAFQLTQGLAARRTKGAALQSWMSKS
jgi:phosphatidylglycerophosphate synthase